MCYSYSCGTIQYNCLHYYSYTFLHDRAGTFASLLYKAEMLSVCLSAIDVTQLSRPFQHGSTQDLVYVIAVVSGTSKFVFISL